MSSYGVIFLAVFVARSAAAPSKTQIDPFYGKIPLTFEKNQGQTDSSVDFVARGAGYTLFLTSREAVLSVGGRAPYAIRMKILGASRSAKPEAVGELRGRSNYFI